MVVLKSYISLSRALHVACPERKPLLQLAFAYENLPRNAPASVALAQVSHQSHNARTANCHLCGKQERNGAQRRTLWQNHDASSGAAVVDEKACLRTRQR